MNQPIKITITKEAADCLAWFASHDMYGPTLSSAIVELTEEWFTRERKDREDCIKDDFKYLEKEQKQ